jgi:hypothetical protein
LLLKIRCKTVFGLKLEYQQRLEKFLI